jgi:hypothetical protein
LLPGAKAMMLVPLTGWPVGKIGSWNKPYGSLLPCKQRFFTQ